MYCSSELSEPAEEQLRIAEAVRAACARVALEAYEQARTDGLCAEGAWELAIAALQNLDLGALVPPAPRATPEQS